MVRMSPSTDQNRPIIDRLLLLIIGVFIAIKLILMTQSGLLDDEAYYWVWGQRSNFPISIIQRLPPG